MPESETQYLSIKNWQKYQPKLKNGKDRRDWIRLDTNLEDDVEFSRLSFFQKSLLIGIWRLKGRTGLNPPNDSAYIARALHVESTVKPCVSHALSMLVTRGFLTLCNQQKDIESALQDKTGQDRTTIPPTPFPKSTVPRAPAGVSPLAQREKQKPKNGNGWKPSEHWPPAPQQDGVKLEDSVIEGMFLAISKAGRWIEISRAN